MLPYTQLRWAAGLFEGSGTFAVVHVKSNGHKYRYFGMRLHLTNESTVRRFHEAVGCGTVAGPYTNASGNPYWIWRASPRQSWELYQQIKRHLSADRVEQAEEVVARCTKHPSETRKRATACA